MDGPLQQQPAPQVLSTVVLDHSPHGIMALQLQPAGAGEPGDFVCTFANPAAQRLLPRGGGGLVGATLRAVTGSAHEVFHAECTRVLAEQRPLYFDVLMDPADGYRWSRVAAVPLDGATLTVTLEDVTELRGSQEQLKRQALVLDTLYDAVFVLDMDGTIIEWTGGAERLFGYRKREALGLNWAMLHLADDAETITAFIADTLRVSDEWRGELVTVCRDGTERVVETVAVPLRDGDGQTIAIVGVSRDVTYRSRAENELRLHAVKQHSLNLELEAQKNVLQEQQRELESINQQLAEASKEARSANEAKSAFLANMSHEIRTPMTAILGYAELLAESGLTAEQRKYVATVQRNGEHLLTIINDILDLSKIEANKMTVERIWMSPTQVVSEIEQLMRPRADGKGIGLRVDFVYPLPAQIRSDPVRFRQVLINLVGNAVKFTESGCVTIRLRYLGGELLRVDVVDSGIGMTPTQVELLFKPFTQVDVSHARRFGGTGLGLTISRRLTEMLGGALTVDSAAGAGSTFSFTVATGPLDGVALLTGAAAAGERATAPEALPTLHGRILLAEDGPDNQRLISVVLRKAGLDVEIAENGRIAFEKVVAAHANGQPYDLVLMDMQMPELDGYAAARKLREHGVGLPIIALTAHAMGGDREKCIAAGCNDYATKPINRAALLEACRMWMGATGSPAAVRGRPSV